MKKKLLYLVAEDSYFCSHRINLAKAAKAKGFTVAVATRCKEHKEKIEAAGIQVFPLKNINRSGLNPWRQLLALKELHNIYKEFKPDVVHHVAVKPVIFGSLIAKYCGVPRVVNALGGLGYLFTEDKENTNSQKIDSKKFVRTAVCIVYRWIFSQPNSILLLQNMDDFETLVQYGAIQADSSKSNTRVSIIPGSGIDTSAYSVQPFPPSPPIILACVSRMLWDKGIGELVDAARILNEKNKELGKVLNSPIKVLLYGEPDPENPASIPVETLKQWNTEGIIEYRGFCKDVASAYASCHIAVLPSYREGLPKSLLEAASIGRPIVTTDVPGCREVVKDGVNGYLAQARNAEDLSQKLRALIENTELQKTMGHQSRLRAEQLFSDAILHEKILSLYTFE